MRNIKKGLFLVMIVCVMLLVPKEEVQAAKRLFNIVVDDGFTKQTIEMKYGKSPSGHTTYYANQTAIYVNQKSKKVTFTVRKNTSSRYGNFRFAANSIKPTNTPKMNLFNYTVDGKTRACLFTVQKEKEPEIKSLSLKPSKGKNFVTGKKNRLEIKTRVQTALPTSMRIVVLNEKGKRVYRKDYKNITSKTYKLSWNGKPSKNNQVNLSTKKYVPAGTYTVAVKLKVRLSTGVKEFTRERDFTITKK